MEITNSNESFEIEVKRLYLEGYKIKAKCPICGNDVEEDLGHDYLSYPKINKPIKFKCYCEQCEDTVYVGDIIIKINIEESVE